MSETRNRAREALKALIADACAQVVTSTEALAEYSGGTAIFNLERDQPLSDLARFPAAYEALQHVPEFVRAFGTEHGERATLQFVYEYFTRTERFEFDIEAFDATFEAFLRELDNPDWTYIAFANLRNFRPMTHSSISETGSALGIAHSKRSRSGWAGRSGILST
jgi:hypothetical protein